MVNRITLVGNVGGAPEIRHLENGTAVGKFSLATNESYMGKDGQWVTNTEWHNIVVWRNLAERAEKSVQKGSMLFLEGKLTHRKWQDKEGITRYSSEVVASYFRILNKREANDGSGNFPSSENQPAMASNSMGQNPVNTQSSQPQTVAPENDDLPF